MYFIKNNWGKILIIVGVVTFLAMKYKDNIQAKIDKLKEGK